MIAPKKSLGQNFLQDKNILRKIADSVELNSSDTVIEIGPGTGALTEYLLLSGAKIISVEIDKRAVEMLKERFTLDKYPNFQLIEGDFLKFDLHSIKAENKIKAVGNIPYYISGDILFKLFYESEMLESAVIMMQKEVAEWIVSHCGTKDYGILGIAAQSVSKIKKCFDVSPNCFYPKPKVTSSVVKFEFMEKLPNEIEYKSFMGFVKAAFSQRRKTLRNSLKSYMAKINVEETPEISEVLSMRAEMLEIASFIELFKKIGTRNEHH